MSITDELRKWGYGFCGDTHDVVTAIADRIDAEHERLCSRSRSNGYSDGFNDGFNDIESWVVDHEDEMAKQGWVRLPKDADGVPIHVGDVMEWPDGETFDVIGIGEGVLFYTESECDGPAEWTGASTKRHHAPTVEDVLREFANKWMDVQPCREPEIIAEYAAKLQIKEDK